MNSPTASPGAELEAIIAEYRARGDVARLLERLDQLGRSAAVPDLFAAIDPYLEMYEVAGPLYERIVEREPENARALVGLANAFWLTGRGPDVVGQLASRAISADPAQRGAWHLWALAEASPRQRVQRWQQVVTRFPADQLALANLADNAAALAGAEDDPVALKLAIASYEALLAKATRSAERAALENALQTLTSWKL